MSQFNQYPSLARWSAGGEAVLPLPSAAIQPALAERGISDVELDVALMIALSSPEILTPEIAATIEAVLGDRAGAREQRDLRDLLGMLPD
jgi:3-oxoacyl-[acyl-carrier-protein] synthase III